MLTGASLCTVAKIALDNICCTDKWGRTSMSRGRHLFVVLNGTLACLESTSPDRESQPQSTSSVVLEDSLEGLRCHCYVRTRLSICVRLV